MHGNAIIRQAARRARQLLAVADVDDDVIQLARGRREIEQPMRGRTAQHGLTHALGGVGVGPDVFENMFCHKAVYSCVFAVANARNSPAGTWYRSIMKRAPCDYIPLGWRRYESRQLSQ